MADQGNRADIDQLRDGEDLITVDLTVSAALERIPSGARANYKAVYEWFMDNSGTYGSRLYGKGQRLPGVTGDFAHCAQRGIHVPAKQKYAISITVKQDSLYQSDQPLHDLGDGTWILVYSAHRNNSGNETYQGWNQGLINCMNDGVPVGVFVERKPGDYYRALAFVETFSPDSDTFTLHGPVTSENTAAFSSPLREVLTSMSKEIEGVSVEALMIDRRRVSLQRKAERLGQADFRRKVLEAYDGECAATNCGVDKVLQAAHIIDYHGPATNIVQNGILLRSDIHTLFDQLLLGVVPDTLEMVVGGSIAGTEYGALHGRRLRRTRDRGLAPDERYLEVKYQQFREREARISA